MGRIWDARRCPQRKEHIRYHKMERPREKWQLVRDLKTDGTENVMRSSLLTEIRRFPIYPSDCLQVLGGQCLEHISRSLQGWLRLQLTRSKGLVALSSYSPHVHLHSTADVPDQVHVPGLDSDALCMHACKVCG